MKYQAIEYGTEKILAESERMDTVLDLALRTGAKRTDFHIKPVTGPRL